MITHDTAWAFKPEIRRQFLKDERLSAALDYSKSKQLKPRRPRDTNGFVYIIKCNDFIKIGLAKNPQQRLSELSVCTPYNLTILRLIETPDMLSTEQALHIKFKEHHHKGEWFRLPPDCLQQLLAMPTSDILDLANAHSTRFTKQALIAMTT